MSIPHRFAARTRRFRRLRVAWLALAVAALLAGASPATAYTVYLKDGSQLITRGAPSLEGDQAIIILQNGTRTSISAAEIDFARTREANKTDLGSALVLEDGEFTTQTKDEPIGVRQETLSEVAGRTRRTRATNRAPVERPEPQATAPSVGVVDLFTTPRAQFRNLAVLEPIQSAFSSQGAGQVKVYQGTAPNRVLLEVTTNSEAAVFRSIRVAAGALTHLRSNGGASIAAFELALQTESRHRAGQFLLEPGVARAIVAGDLEISEFFVRYVRF